MAEEEEEGWASPDPAAQSSVNKSVTKIMDGATAYVVGIVGLALCIELIVILFAAEEIHGPGAGANQVALIAVSACVLGLASWGISTWLLARAYMKAARLLLDAGQHDPAIRRLKRLARKQSPLADEATYLIALSYDRQGSARMAEEAYRAYLERFEKDRGEWALEARVRLEELGAELAAPPPVVQAQAAPAKPDLRCPFCKDTFGEEAVTAECADCATPHHLACYDEQGGCSVYGCRSSTVKTRARE